MEILDKADELGKLIGESNYLKRYRNAQIALLNDKELNEQLNNYKLKYNEFLKSKDKNLENEINSMFDQLNENQVFREFLISKDQYEKMMETVQGLIRHYVESDNIGTTDASSKSKGCNVANCASGDCSSCKQ